MIESLNVEKRETTGKRRNRRLRAAGKIPAILYGHGQDNVSLSVPAEDFATVIRHGSRMLRLTGAINDTALIKECHWNTWGTEVLHIDFARTSLDEKITAQVVIELRGEAPGSKEGGVVSQALHDIEVECAAASIPDHIEISINDLELEGQITVADLELGSGVTVLADPETVLVTCATPVEAPEEGEEEAGEAEPEIIGRKEEEGEE